MSHTPSKSIQAGVFYGVGVGPGDPELLTFKAARLIQSADLVVFLENTAGNSQARNIAALALKDAQSQQKELPITMPMQEDRVLANKAYDRAAEMISDALDTQLSVVFLCEGDPLFFGSFSYLLMRLKASYPCKVVPGICSVNAASAALNLPLTLLNESLAVVSARNSDEEILRACNNFDSLLILKAGRSRPRLLKLLTQSGRSHDAKYLEYIGRDNQKIASDVEQLDDEAGPYFSLFVITPDRKNAP